MEPVFPTFICLLLVVVVVVVVLNCFFAVVVVLRVIGKESIYQRMPTCQP